MVDYLCIIQARVSSSRLPSKVMLDLSGKTLLERVYETVSKSKKIDKIIVATSIEESDDIIELKCKQNNIEVFRGDLNNVLERFYISSKKYNAKNIVRITADNPLMDGSLLDELINTYEQSKKDYSMYTNAIYGLSGEVFSFISLEEAFHNARDDYDKEHVTPYIRDIKQTHIIDVEEKYRKPQIRATVDTLEDYINMQKFFIHCQKNNTITDVNQFIQYQDK